ncbi:hypothetical protein [Lactobacillus sp. CBA3605]|uniref:hypothetical protein n=1 Tax=Lactobacillus sp. CBA3605 TaxID=2099788 RepID=UPI001319D8DB|nr:hypothetical protein [Lactobacillus sp. CBA3605]
MQKLVSGGSLAANIGLAYLAFQNKRQRQISLVKVARQMTGKISASQRKTGNQQRPH